MTLVQQLEAAIAEPSPIAESEAEKGGSARSSAISSVRQPFTRSLSPAARAPSARINRHLSGPCAIYTRSRNKPPSSAQHSRHSAIQPRRCSRTVAALGGCSESGDRGRDGAERMAAVEDIEPTHGANGGIKPPNGAQRLALDCAFVFLTVTGRKPETHKFRWQSSSWRICRIPAGSVQSSRGVSKPGNIGPLCHQGHSYGSDAGGASAITLRLMEFEQVK